MRYIQMPLNYPLRYASCGQFVSNVPWTHAARTLDTHVLLIGTSGTLHIQQSWQAFELGAGQALLLIAGESHSGTRPCEPGLSYFWCHFSIPGYTPKVLNQQRFQLELNAAMPASVPFENSIIIPEYGEYKNAERVNISCKQLLHISNTRYYPQLATDCCLTLILMELSAQFTYACTAEAANAGRSAWRLADIQEWIHIHIDEPITASQVAAAFGYNVTYLSGQLKRSTGMSLTRYIQAAKLEKAKELLLRTNLDIANVALLVGYADVKYFMRLFKLHEGMTPSGYRGSYFRTHMNKH